MKKILIISIILIFANLKGLSQNTSEKNVKSIIVNRKGHSFVKTLNGDFYGYGNNKFFRRTYNQSINGEFIRTADIQENENYIFLTVVTGKQCVKEQIDKYILPLNKKSSHYLIEDVKGINANKNLVVFFKLLDDNGDLNKSLYPLTLKNIKTNKTQILKVSLVGKCASEKVENVKFVNNEVVVEYLDEKNILKIFKEKIVL
jgi:hypothetical protein